SSGRSSPASEPTSSRCAREGRISCHGTMLWPISSMPRAVRTWSPPPSTASRCCARASLSISTPNESSPTRRRSLGDLPMPEPDRFRCLPKVELHLHAAGSVRPTTMREFVATDRLPPSLGERYGPAVAGEGLSAYLTRFAAWDATVTTTDRLERVVAELVDDLRAAGGSHAEVRLRPPTDDDGLWHAMMESAIRTARAVAMPTIGFIAVMLRGWSAERAAREARRAAKWAGRGIVAIDIAGDEALGGLRPLARAVRVARESGLAIATHAGETGGAPAMREALTLLAPDRIAHGVGAAQDAWLIAELRDRGLHLEMAIRSNVQTGAVEDLSRHPFAALLRSGV